jgi:hypothetical protein
MAITKAQQAKQMLRDGTNYNPSKIVSVPKEFKARKDSPNTKLAYITKDEEKLLKKLKPGTPHKGPEGIPNYDSFDISGGYTSGRDIDDRTGQARDPGQRFSGGTKQQEKETRERNLRNLAAAEKAQKERLAQQKAIREKEERQRKIREETLRKRGLAATTKFGAPIIGPKSNISNFKEIETLKSLGAIEEDDSDDKATAKAIVEQNPLQKFLSNIPSTTGIIGSILEKIPGRSLDEMYDQYIKDKTGFKFKEYAGDKGRKLFKQDVLAGKISSKGGPMGGFGRDEMGNTFGPGGDGRDNQIIPPIVPTTTGSVTPEEEVDNRTEFEKLLASRPGAFRFFADGGRVPAQQGGIMPRLNELSGDVSSAEQMLQEINQRLESAESTLGGGDPANGLIAIQPNNFQPRQMPIGQPTQTTPFDGRSLAMRNAVGTLTPAPSYSGGRLVPDLRTAGLEQLPNNTAQGMEGFAPQPGGPIQSPLQQAVGFADGGRADDEEDYVGGIMDLESARQMYGLGKLVKKVTRGVKKIVKSPLGKAALLGAGLGFAGYGPMKGLFSGVKGAGFLKNMAINKKLLGTADYMGGPTGIFDLIKSNPFKSIFAASTLAGLMTPKQQDGDEEVYLGPTIDIPGIRKNPYAAMGETYRFYADGGKAEPVAKKTMPLLDMDGMEKDYREDGGFVPIGRMERADDVPARLSKNEFVFTADAVRNAGDGDVDKGAEVMYNMMKNLEAGGNVSEESQGLDGARKMFQTSQRLEEVL